MLNFHKIFCEAPDRDDFLARLDVPDDERENLAAARDIIRAELRAGFVAWQDKVDRWTVLAADAIRKSAADPKLKPKFRMQGSASYHTLNNPAQHPPQQIDYDDGVYLPISFLAETGNPIIASAGYFRLVEACLAPVCDRNGWTLSEKPSCVRVELDDKAHIDLPLYAIPDEEFESLIETASVMKSLSEQQIMKDSIEVADSVYGALLEDEIRLAHRQDGWIKSDPRLIENWFKEAIDTHGYQLRRVCRYFKAWRDHMWDTSSLSSITVMKCVVDAFDDVKGSLDQKRDDLAILQVAVRLEDYFSGDIRNPVLDSSLNEGWTEEDRAAFAAGAIDLRNHLNAALEGSDNRSAALAELTKSFGPRLPQDEDLIIPTAEATVKSYEPTKVPAPHVPRTTSG